MKIELLLLIGIWFVAYLWQVRSRGRYRRLLQDHRWKKRAIQIKYRDGWQCVIPGCGEQRRWLLQAHHCRWAYRDHRPYYAPGLKPWEAADINLETLCDWHHAQCSR